MFREDDVNATIETIEQNEHRRSASRLLVRRQIRYWFRQGLGYLADRRPRHGLVLPRRAPHSLLLSLESLSRRSRRLGRCQRCSGVFAQFASLVGFSMRFLRRLTWQVASENVNRATCCHLHRPGATREGSRIHGKARRIDVTDQRSLGFPLSAP